MKKILPALFLLCGLLSHSQNKIADHIKELQSDKRTFKPVSVLDVATQTPSEDLRKVVDNATLATIKLDDVNQIANGQYETIAVEIPFKGQTLKTLLYKVDIFAEGFHVDTDKATNVPYQKGVYYRGILEGDNHSLASFNFFNGEFNGVISAGPIGNVVVGKLDRAGNTTEYIVYSDAEMRVLNGFDCGVKDDEFPPAPANYGQHRDIQSDRCVTMYFEVDYNIYVGNGLNLTAATNWMTSVYNNMQMLYVADDITTALKSIFVWTTLDPYDGVGTTSGAYLNLFHETRPVFDGDLGQLVGIDPGGLGGLAVTINGLCNANNYCYSDVNFSYSTVPTYSWTINVLTHEFGHLLGSRHTHACVWNGNNTSIDGCGQQAGYTEGSCATGPIPSASEKGTIMSYCHLISGVGINLANGFGIQPATAIINAVNNGACLSTDCVNTCINTVTAINVTDINQNSVAITWTDLSTTQNAWQVAVTPFASSAIVWNDVTTNSYTATGLIPNTYYKVRVRPLCTGLTATSRVQIFATSVTDYCAGITFRDSGGSGNYTNNESFVRTLMPTGPGLKIRATFTAFNLEADYDYLYIYNGPDISYPEVTGGLTGTTVPGVYNSTDESGALTFRFFSDQGVVAAGWSAFINCTGTLGLDSNEFIDFSYAPNPTNGNVAITSKTTMTEVAVYSVTGQLLYKNNLNDLEANVDLSPFAVGTYFFKLKFEGDHETNFKVLKN